MNERIRELYEQAHGHKPTMVVDHETGQAVHASFRGEPMYTKDFDPKKFAELIVRECMDLVKDCYAESGRSLYQTVCASTIIEEHFGVEE